MKTFYILALVLSVAYADETYSTENDHLDIESVVNDVNKLKSFVECFLGKSPCDSQMQDFKNDMPEAVQQACAKCTGAQKHIFRIFLQGLKDKLPSEYEEYKNKYDPENKHFPTLEVAVANA